MKIIAASKSSIGPNRFHSFFISLVRQDKHGVIADHIAAQF